MSLTDELKLLGADTDDAIKRFMGKTDLYEKMVKKFPEAATKDNVTGCFEAQDFEAAVAGAHTLKGITGNLSLTPLYEAYTNIVALLRAGENESAKKALDAILPLQEKFIQCIENNK